MWCTHCAVDLVAIAATCGKPDVAGYVLQPHRTRLTLSVDESTDPLFYGSSDGFDDARKDHCHVAGCGQPDQLANRVRGSDELRSDIS